MTHRARICILILVAISMAAVVPSTNRDGHARFQTLPQFRPPLLDVTIYDAERLTSGYFFLAPYSQLEAKQIIDPAEAYITGPTIYDSTGQLIWVGSTKFPGRDAHDFKVVSKGGELMLSYIVSPNEFYPEHPQGKAVLLNAEYEVVKTTLPLFDTLEFNIHEYKVINDGQSVLTLYTNPTLVNETWISDDGIAEIDLSTGKTLFRWSSMEHIPLNASNFHLPKPESTSKKRPWDWFHANSIDKNAEGDYLLSSRHTSCIYKISGTTGAILWKLGGKNSDFDHSNGFNFSWQHDARYKFEDGTTTTISLFDNAGVGITAEAKTTGNWSRAVVVELDTSAKPMTTRLLYSYDRPDHEISIARGNMQTLPNDNVLVGWATSGLISEFTRDGKSVMEAKFVDKKMSTYRSYKFNFTGNPQSPPTIKSFVHGSTPDTANTFHYISWNGATDVHSWNIYGSLKQSLDDGYELLGHVEKTDFETVYMTKGFMPHVYAEAIGADGRKLGRSVATLPEYPKPWFGAFCTEDGDCKPKNLEATSQGSEKYESENPDEYDLSESEDLLDVESSPYTKAEQVGTPSSIFDIVNDKPMIVLAGVTLLAVIVCVYLALHIYKRRNIIRYKPVE